MTREERINNGWVRWWGIFNWDDRMWLAANGSNWTSSTTPGARKLADYPTMHADALARGTYDRTVLRPVWRRKKPKAPPPLAERFETHAVTYADHASHMPSLGLLHKVRESLQQRDGQPVRIIIEKP